ncbi:energy transducer TonB [Bradyrhizobium sp.]|uniref:energy transducer TonB n=1 Tax=Bradyrhizobium sp. TaxID=376 RepID=UPI0025B8F264|nr:energy transducer TonB [Bradyrhizobium sp.]
MLAVSAAAHAAVLVAVGGHPRPASASSVDDRAVEVDVATEKPAEPVSDDEARREPEAHAPAFPRMHTHPYPVPESHDWTPHDPSLVHVHAPWPLPAPHVDPTPAAPAPAIESEELPHFNIPAGSGSPVASHVTAAHDHDHDGAGHAGDAHGGGEAEPPAPEQSVSTPARLLRGASPAYPPAARAQGVEADVPLEIIVSQGGAVESARIVTHAGFGFDQAALDAIRGYRFSPAEKGGRPTRVRMRWTMQFRLQ